MTGAPVGSIFRPARILVSDSEVLSREVVSRRLAGLGYECECCENGQSALDMLAGRSYDLFLTDIVMPLNGGVDFLQCVLEIHPDIAIILITSIVNIEVAVEALKHGAYDYITKPFSMEGVSISVSRALEKRRLLLENENYRRTLEAQVASRTNQLKEALGVLEQTYHSTLVALSKALDSRDADSDGHTLRITVYASRLARQLGVSEPDMRVIEQGVLLHDVGNIGIPDALLEKREALDDNERLLMRKHPEIGYGILSRIKFLKAPAELVLQHHERYDGQGYPQGLKGEQINLGARIFAVADAFEALTYSYPFHDVSDFEESCREIRNMSGAELDPMIVKRFLEIPFDEWKEIRRDVEANAEPAKMQSMISGSNSN
jgi:response regulator RpfG family c-di-GMP phosphodiesterase